MSSVGRTNKEVTFHLHELIVFLADSPRLFLSAYDDFLVFYFHRVLILRKRPTRLKLLCGLAVVVGLFVCLIPTIFPSVDPKAERTKSEARGVSRVLWPLIFMLGFVSVLFILSGCYLLTLFQNESSFKTSHVQWVWFPWLDQSADGTHFHTG